MKDKKADIIVLGGGLAGLTLALQLRRNIPSLRITVLDKRNREAQSITHKVGESFVEVSSFYLGEVLGLRNYLLKEHLPKYGLRFFVKNNNDGFENRSEYGLFQLKSVPGNYEGGIPGIHQITYNLDRGKLENHLTELCEKNDVNLLFDTRITDVSFNKPHLVQYEEDGEPKEMEAEWVIDATGQARFLARKLDLTSPQNHEFNAVWFRINGRIDPGSFSQNKSYQNRMDHPIRWLSTNHLMGNGYWIWLIPIGKNATSIGIMSDPKVHNFELINRLPKTLDWLSENEAPLAAEIKKYKTLDFRIFKSKAYNSKQIFSLDKWALTGETAFMSDALYSPGGDFIAVGNTLITKIIQADFSKNRQMLSQLMKFGERLLNGMYNHYMGLYKGAYAMMGKPEVMMQKVAWDTAIYFGYNVLLFRNGVFCDPDFHKQIWKESARIEKLQQKMIAYFNAYQPTKFLEGHCVDQSEVSYITDLYNSSRIPLNNKELVRQLTINVDILEEFSHSIKQLVV